VTEQLKTPAAETEPLWRDEFSISRADERYVSRRQLAKFLTLASLGMFAGNLWILIRSWFRKAIVYPRAVVARASEIPVGGVKLFQYPKQGEQCIMIRIAENDYVAYSQKCTHLSCAVFYARENNRLECPCHQGYFSIKDGSVLQGPPTRPLPRVMLERNGDDLIAIRIEPEA
jgi:Rieske Fe-S protein